MQKPVHIPSELIDRNTIENMPLGHEAYIVPWGIFCNEQGELWCVKGYSTHPEPMGTVEMRIRRVDGGILVDRQTMKPMRPHRPVYGGCTEEDYMPVLGFFNERKPSPIKIWGSYLGNE